MRNWLLTLFLFISLRGLCQEPAHKADSLPQKNYSARKWLVGGFSAAGYGSSIYILNKAWYKDYPRTSFHTFNDAGEWKQMDKIGHAWTTYNTSRIVSGMWRWAGQDRKSAVLLGTGSSILFMTSIEYLDGLSADWGWSWPDFGMNMFGAALFASQELGWKDQKIQLKFSTHFRNYKDPQLEQRANDLFGKSWQERMLKDYNAQTYWLSFNLSALTNSQKLPSWLSIAVGYGAGGMFGGYENRSFDETGNPAFDRRDIARYRQWYLAPDIDLTRIRTRSKFVRSALFVLNAFKFPAPALELSSGKLKVKALVF